MWLREQRQPSSQWKNCRNSCCKSWQAPLPMRLSIECAGCASVSHNKKKENVMNKNHLGKLRKGTAAGKLVRGMLIALIAVAVTGIASAQSGDGELKFKGGIGVIPVTGVAANGTVNLNVVRGVSPGAPWRIADLTAVVGFNGHIQVVGRGLLLASGNGIGTNAGQRVHATLFCGAANTATAHDSNPAGVSLG